MAEGTGAKVTATLFHNRYFWILFGPTLLVWGYVSFSFARNWWRRRNVVSMMLAVMPLGNVVSALRELHLLNRAPASYFFIINLTVGVLTCLVLHHNRPIPPRT